MPTAITYLAPLALVPALACGGECESWSETGAGLSIRIENGVIGSKYQLEVVAADAHDATETLAMLYEVGSREFLTTCTPISPGVSARRSSPVPPSCVVEGSHFVMSRDVYVMFDPQLTVRVAALDGLDIVGPVRATVRVHEIGGALLVDELVSPTYQPVKVFDETCRSAERADVMIELPAP